MPPNRLTVRMHTRAEATVPPSNFANRHQSPVDAGVEQTTPARKPSASAGCLERHSCGREGSGGYSSTDASGCRRPRVDMSGCRRRPRRQQLGEDPKDSQQHADGQPPAQQAPSSTRHGSGWTGDHMRRCLPLHRCEGQWTRGRTDARGRVVDQGNPPANPCIDTTITQLDPIESYASSRPPQPNGHPPEGIDTLGSTLSTPSSSRSTLWKNSPPH